MKSFKLSKMKIMKLSKLDLKNTFIWRRFQLDYIFNDYSVIGNIWLFWNSVIVLLRNLDKEFWNKEAFWPNIITVIYYVIEFILSRNLASMLVYYSTIRKSWFLHEIMIRLVLNVPINTYFDKTPSGTILNRFSRDLSKLDEEIFR